MAGRALRGRGVGEDLAGPVADDDLRDVCLVRLDPVHEHREADRDHLTGVKPSGRKRVELGNCAFLRQSGAGEGAEREERADR